MDKEEVGPDIVEEDFSKDEVAEYRLVEEWRKKIADGDDVPEEIKAKMAIIDGIDLKALLDTVPDRPLGAFLKALLPGMTKLTIQLEEAVVEIQYPDGGVACTTIVYPLENGERLYIDAIIPQESSSDLNIGVLMA